MQDASANAPTYLFRPLNTYTSSPLRAAFMYSPTISTTGLPGEAEIPTFYGLIMMNLQLPEAFPEDFRRRYTAATQVPIWI